MITQKNNKQGRKKDKSNQFRIENQQVNLISKLIKSITGGLIGIVLTGLFSIVVLAFVVKAFFTSEATALQLLNSVITIAGTTLGAVLGYFLGKNAGGRAGE
jgi:F0F1-type ATP synthase assembly protein I